MPIQCKNSIFFPIMRNALRLFEDAELLFKNGRYPTAVSLAITSIEEAGKYVIKAREANQNKITDGNKQFDHIPKHYELGQFYWNMAIWKVLLDTFDDFKNWLQRQPDLSEYYSRIKDLKQNEAVNYLQHFMFQSNDELESYVKEKYPHKQYLEVRKHAQVRQVEKMRQAGLYCDINSTDQITNDPEKFTQANAEEWLVHAHFAMAQMMIWHDILENKDHQTVSND